jgi:putative tryptophan/tyrosine transport system substrate-binding protein
MRRREFIAGLGLAAVWPIALRGQQGGRARRIGMLLLGQENTPNSRAGVAELRKLGWVVGRNLEIDYHWVLGDAEEMRSAIAELSAVTPDVIVTAASPTLAAATFQIAKKISQGPKRNASGADKPRLNFIKIWL